MSFKRSIQGEHPRKCLYFPSFCQKDMKLGYGKRFRLEKGVWWVFLLSLINQMTFKILVVPQAYLSLFQQVFGQPALM